jgi:hypothetical protein
MKSTGQQMFTLLTSTDGVQAGVWDPFWCIDADEMHDDFMRKYNKSV